VRLGTSHLASQITPQQPFFFQSHPSPTLSCSRASQLGLCHLSHVLGGQAEHFAETGLVQKCVCLISFAAYSQPPRGVRLPCRGPSPCTRAKMLLKLTWYTDRSEEHTSELQSRGHL